MGIGDHFHSEMRFTIGQTTTDGRAHAGSLFWVQGIHIKTEVNAILVKSRNGQGFAHNFGNAALINIRHSKDMNSVGMQALSFSRVKVARTNDNDSFSMNFRIPSADISQVPMTYACQRGQYHPVVIAGWRCLIGIEIGVGVSLDYAYIFVYPGN